MHTTSRSTAPCSKPRLPIRPTVIAPLVLAATMIAGPASGASAPAARSVIAVKAAPAGTVTPMAEKVFAGKTHGSAWTPRGHVAGVRHWKKEKKHRGKRAYHTWFSATTLWTKPTSSAYKFATGAEAVVAYSKWTGKNWKRHTNKIIKRVKKGSGAVSVKWNKKNVRAVYIRVCLYQIVHSPYGVSNDLACSNWG